MKYLYAKLSGSVLSAHAYHVCIPNPFWSNIEFKHKLSLTQVNW